MMRMLGGFFEGRPLWINLLMLFCIYMTLFYLPFDLFWKPMAEDQEVWFGMLLQGVAAKATEPLHWMIYAAGAWGLYRMRPWIWPWAPLYVAQIAIGMWVWQIRDERGFGFTAGFVASVPFWMLCVVLWRARDLFHGKAAQDSRT